MIFIILKIKKGYRNSLHFEPRKIIKKEKKKQTIERDILDLDYKINNNYYFINSERPLWAYMVATVMQMARCAEYERPSFAHTRSILVSKSSILIFCSWGRPLCVQYIVAEHTTYIYGLFMNILWINYENNTC